MGKIKVTILSKETIKPSQPTSNSNSHPHSIPLSLFDQLAPPIYTHILFFYSTYSLDLPQKLKSSLSQTLNHFYPFAGRIRDTGNGKLHVECNNEGVEFVETLVFGASLDSIHRQGPNVEAFNELLPIKKSMFDFREDHKDAPLLGVQIGALDDAAGGFILGVSVCHLVADGASLSMFLRWWSRTARGSYDDLSALAPPRFDCASVFPPQAMITTQSKQRKRRSCEDINSGPNPNPNPNQHVAIRCFEINSEVMERLRQVDGGGQSTRVEAVSALIWRCIKRAQADENNIDILSLSHVVNFRNRMAPLLSQESMGNMFITVKVADQLAPDNADSFASIEQSIRSATRRVNEQLIRSKARQMLDEREGTEKGVRPERIREWIFSSWCRMGWYECDFGVEDQPVWVACGITDMKDVCILLDAKDGRGMEVWLWMDRNEMERVVSDHEFQKFVCFS